MLTSWDAVSTLDRMFDDMMGSALGAATNSRTFNPDIDVRTTDEELLLEEVRRFRYAPSRSAGHLRWELVGIFDEIMIDDFWFTDCTCPECDAARRSKTVRIGDTAHRVAGDTWEDYRCELMVQLSREKVLKPA